MYLMARAALLHYRSCSHCVLLCLTKHRPTEQLTRKWGRCRLWLSRAFEQLQLWQDEELLKESGEEAPRRHRREPVVEEFEGFWDGASVSTPSVPQVQVQPVLSPPDPNELMTSSSCSSTPRRSLPNQTDPTLAHPASHCDACSAPLVRL